MTNTDTVDFGGIFGVDFARHLSRHDVVYETPTPTRWDGLPLGDGEAGALFWMPPRGPRWELGRCDLWDDGPERPFDPWGLEDEEVATALRSAGSLAVTTGLPALDWMYLKEFSARLDLFSARATMRAVTPFSEVEIATWMSREAGVLVVEYRDALVEETPRRIELERWGGRVFAHWYNCIIRDPARGLDGTEAGVSTSETGTPRIWISQRTRSNRFAVAVAVDGAEATPAREHRRAASLTVSARKSVRMRLYVAIVSDEIARDPLAEALDRVERARHADPAAMWEAHSARWKAFWERSFVRIPDDFAENLWYLNHYAMGSSALGAYPPHFINGIWNANADIRSWNHYYHWNEQEITWPVAAAGHPELAYGYLRMRAASLPRAQESARRVYNRSGAWYNDVFDRRGWQCEGPPIFTPGLQIALDAWRIWRHSADETLLREVCWPLMRETCRFYLDLLEKGDDGRYHLPASHPYEHASHYNVRDGITDLAHVRSAFPKTAVIADLMGEERFAARLREVASKLPDVELIPIPDHYLSEDNGCYANPRAADRKPPFDRMVSAGRHVDTGTPVTYHAEREGVGRDPLFPGANDAGVYPSGSIGLADRGSDVFCASRATALATWDDSMGWTIHPIVFARLGMADEVAEALRKHVELFLHFPQGLWNYQASQDGSAANLGEMFQVTDRFAGSDKFPFPRWPHTHFGLEPGAVFQATINEALLQSYDGMVRLCPAAPADWSGAFVLWAEGGFRVACVVREGKPVAAAITSARGEECRFVPDSTSADPASARPDLWRVQDAGSGDTVAATISGEALVFATEPGKTYRVVPVDGGIPATETFSGAPAAHPKQRGNRWIGIPRRW